MKKLFLKIKSWLGPGSKIHTNEHSRPSVLPTKLMPLLEIVDISTRFMLWSGVFDRYFHIPLPIVT